MEIMKFSDIEIFNVEDLAESMFNGVTKLLNCELERIRFISSEYDEDLIDTYYRLESDANHIEREENLLLCEMDEVNFVLWDNEYHVILFRDSDEENVKAMF